MMFIIFDENRETTTNMVNDYRYRVTYEVYDVIRVNDTERYDSDYSSSDGSSSDGGEYADNRKFGSEYADYRKFSRLQIDDLMFSIFLEVDEQTAP